MSKLNVKQNKANLLKKKKKETVGSNYDYHTS